MRLLLHIGTHKTGTTAVQKFCARNRERLRGAGLWYPDYDLIGAEGHYAHHHLANAVSGLPTSRGRRDDAARFFDLVRMRAGADETVLISAEPFWRHVCPPIALKENERVGDLAAYWQHRRAFVEQVAETVGVDSVEVVVVLRRQDLCIESMFKERIKGTGYTGDFETFAAAFSHRFLYFDQLSVWAEVFPKLQVLIYEDLVASGHLVQAFFRALHVGVEEVDGGPVGENRALSNDLIAYKLMLNRTGLNEHRLYRITEAMLDPGFEGSIELDKGSTLWRSQVEQTSFLEDFADQNVQVRARFTSLERETLFPDMKVAPRRAYGGLSADRSSEIAAGLARVLAEQG